MGRAGIDLQDAWNAILKTAGWTGDGHFAKSESDSTQCEGLLRMPACECEPDVMSICMGRAVMARAEALGAVVAA